MENFLRGSFGEKNRLAFRVFHQDRHHAPGEVEWYLIQLLILLDDRHPMEVRTLQNRPVKQVFQSRLEVANQISVQQHVLTFASC